MSNNKINTSNMFYLKKKYFLKEAVLYSLQEKNDIVFLNKKYPEYEYYFEYLPFILLNVLIFSLKKISII